MNADRPDQLDTVDEFEEFGNEEFEAEAPPPQNLRERLMTQWRDNPGFKMLVILGVGAVILGVAFLFMNSSSKPMEANASHVAAGNSNVKGNVGADVSPEYKKILEESNKKAAEAALQTGTSAIATPVGNVVDSTPPKTEAPIDPLAMWRQAEQKPTPAPTPAPAPAPIPVQTTAQTETTQQIQQQNQQNDQQAEQAIQQQITSLMQAWGPTSATVVSFTQPQKTAAATTAAQTAAAAAATPTKVAKVIVPAGDINYGTMITEANSDVPGPILAQITSGPLQGGRVIGSFTSTDEYLILKFNLLSIGGHTYTIDAIALDPDTTLGAVATETDQRYFARVVLPAAASFISQFGSAISTPSSTTSQDASSTVTTTQPSTTRQALYAGAGQAAQQVSSFVSSAGNQVKPLVRVASNTAIGIFFTKPVTDQPQGQ